jgi:hypothetical protein
MKYLSATLVFLLAVMLQLWFAPGGMRGDFVLAVLIVFSFVFEFWELLIFVLLAAFLMNAAFHPDLAVLMLVLVPLAVFAVRRRFSLDPWLGIPAVIAVGIVLFYAVTAPVAALHAIGFLLIDILICILFGELVLVGMEV